MGFSEYNSTEELLKSLEEYIFNKRYNHDTVDLVFEALSKNVRHRVFIFKESLTNSPRGIVGEKYSRCTNVSKKDVKKLTTGYIILILVQFCCVIWRAVRESNNFFSHKILFWYNIILFLSTWNTFLCYISTFFSKPSYFLCNVKLFISTQNCFSCNTKFLFCTSFGMLCLDDILLLSHSNKNIFTCEKINKLSFLCDTKKIISFFLRHHFSYLVFTLHIVSMLIFFVVVLETNKLFNHLLLTCLICIPRQLLSKSPWKKVSYYPGNVKRLSGAHILVKLQACF